MQDFNPTTQQLFEKMFRRMQCDEGCFRLAVAHLTEDQLVRLLFQAPEPLRRRWLGLPRRLLVRAARRLRALVLRRPRKEPEVSSTSVSGATPFVIIYPDPPRHHPTDDPSQGWRFTTNSDEEDFQL